MQFCLQILHSGRLDPLLAVKDVLVLVDSNQLVAGHGLDNANLLLVLLILPVLPGGLLGAREGLLHSHGGHIDHHLLVIADDLNIITIL